MIDLVQLRREPDLVKAALVRRGVPGAEVDELENLDSEHRRLLQDAERLRAEVKDLSRQVGEARRNKDVSTAEALAATSRALVMRSVSPLRRPRRSPLACPPCC